MGSNKQAINAKLDEKYLYQTYTVGKLASHFGVAKKELHESTDYSTSVQFFDLLSSNFGFNERVLTLHQDRKKLNLDTLMDPKKFAKSMILEQFLIGEATLDARGADNFVMFIHVGAMVLVMYRGEDFELGANLIIDTPNDGSFVIARVQEYLQSRYPKSID